MTFLVSATERSSIIKLVVTMFNAAPGAAYLAELATSFEANGRSLVKLANDLANTTAYNTLNPVFQTAGEFATAFLKPLGLEGNTVAVDFVTSKLNAGVSKGQIAYDASTALNAYTGTDAQLLAAKAILSNKAAVAEYYSVTKGVAETDLTLLKAALAGVTSDVATVADVKAALADSTPEIIGFSAGQDALKGTAGSDVINGYIVDNQNTFQSGDTVDGKAGTDELQVELGNSSAFAIRASTANVEKVFFTSQSANWGSQGNNNVDTTGQVNTVDAEKMVGVKEWWSTDARADLKIEDIRILDSEITSDITIGLRNTDPGSMGNTNNKVDFEVYFSPESLRPASVVESTSLALVISNPLRVVDGFKAAKPLDNVPYTKFAFNMDGKQVIVDLNLTNVDTYDQLYAALTKAIAAKPELAGMAVERIVGGYPYFSTDGEARLADKFILTLADHTLTPVDPGWMATSGLPADNAFLATVQPGDTTATDPLITSKIILDNVGREDEAGTLTIGSMSTHGGVERFDVVVENNADNAYAGTQSGSWLGHMSSTNNTLREVTVVNAADGIANADYLYLGTNMDQAGNNLDTQQDWPGGLDRVYDEITPVNTVPTSLVNADGLTDVRLFDASGMKGDVFVGASITGESIRKYQDLVNTLLKDQADDVAFKYLTGSGDDSIHLELDAGVLNSNSNIVAGRHDFSFLADGGAGDDSIQVEIVNPAKLTGSNQDWYVNQGINANVRVNGGAGNDMIVTAGAGDASINGGSGNDSIYADNSGSSAIWVFNTADTNPGVPVVRDADIFDIRSDDAASVSAVNAKLTVSFMGFSKTVAIADSVGKLSNVTISDLSINQAIKDAINSDSVLSKLLLAVDGPGRTLGVASLIDGAMTTDDLSISFSNTALTTAQSGLTLFPTAANSALLDAYATTLATGIAGTNSAAVSDNTITGETGNDVIVLGTTLGINGLTSSNDTVVFTGSGNGTDSIVNFVSGVGVDADVLNFGAYDVSGVYVDGALLAGVAPTAKLDQYVRLVESKTNDGQYTMTVVDSGADNAFGGTGANLDVVVTTIGVVDFGAQQAFVAGNFSI